MAELTTKRRQSLKPTQFALPGKGEGPKGKGAGSYPIPDAVHARNALARVAQHGSSEEKARVRAAVGRKFPGVEQSKQTEKKDKPRGNSNARISRELGRRLGDRDRR